MTESRGQLSRFAAVFAGGTMLSRVLGLIRDAVAAAVIPTAARDAFFFAFRIPNMLRDMLGEGATNAAFIPVLTETQEKEGDASFRELVAAIYSAMFVILSVVTLLGILAMPLAPYVLHALEPLTGSHAKSAEEMAETVRIMQWTFPYLLFIGLTAFAMAPLFVMKHYGTPSWSPMLLNVALIVAPLVLTRYMVNEAWAMVVGVWLGGLAQLVVNLRAMRKHTGVLWPSFRLRHPGVRKASWLLIPVILGQATGEVNKLVESFFAYSLEEGTVTALFFANRLVQLPLSIFGVAVAVAILPSISRAAANHKFGDIRNTLLHGYRQTFFLAFPAMMGLVVLREPIMRLLFERGAFGPAETGRAAAALFYYGLGLLSFVWVKISVQGFYAVQDTRTPVIIATASMFLNILLNAALVGPMGFRGLALATTVSFTVNFLLLYVYLYARYGLLWDRATGASLFRMFLATAMTCGLLVVLDYRIERYFGIDGLGPRLIAVLVPLAAAAIAYPALCRALNVSEMTEILTAFRRRS